MKKFISILALMLCSAAAFAQSPQEFAANEPVRSRNFAVPVPIPAFQGKLVGSFADLVIQGSNPDAPTSTNGPELGRYFLTTGGIPNVRLEAGTVITFATLTATQTLTNKTLTSPVINVGSDATGDIYYRSAGGAFTRLGVGSNGNVLTLASGLPSWAAPAAGGGTFSFFTPLKPPASPHAKDDEFNGGSLDAGWTIFQSSGLTVTTVDGLAKLVSVTHAGNKYQGFFKTVPSGDWVMIARMIIDPNPSGTSSMGLCLFQDATGNPNTSDLRIYGVVCSTSINPIPAVETWADYQNFTTTDTSISDDEDPNNEYYLKLVKSGTTYIFFISRNGVGWYQVLSGTIGFTPAEFGFVINNAATGIDQKGYVDFVRVYTVEPGYTGGTVTVTTQ